MKVKIELMSALDYSKGETLGTRLAYHLVGENSVVNNERFKGRTELSSYYNSDIFKEIPAEWTKEGVYLDAVFEQRQDYKNPLKTTNVLVSISYNGRTIKLV